MFGPAMAVASARAVNMNGSKSVIELGYQTPRSYDRVNALIGPLDYYKTTADFYKQLGVEEYESIDMGDYDCLHLDLNKEHEFDRTYDLVTNYGTSEHIFNQKAVFVNMHRLCSVGGVMIHCLPVTYFDHGFYNYCPNLFYSVARENKYEFQFAYLTHANQDKIVPMPEDWISLPHEKRRNWHLSQYQGEHAFNRMMVFASKKTADYEFKIPTQHVLYEFAS